MLIVDYATCQIHHIGRDLIETQHLAAKSSGKVLGVLLASESG